MQAEGHAQVLHLLAGGHGVLFLLRGVRHVSLFFLATRLYYCSHPRYRAKLIERCSSEQTI